MKLPQLTFTRFIAAFFIVVFHFGRNVSPFNQPMLADWIGLAPAGVSYFFLLSGFILTLVYNKGEKELINKKKYFIARFFRIYPLYILALIILITFLLLTKQIIDLRALFLQIILLQAWFPNFSVALNIPSWSLSVEMFFYVIFPFLLIGLRKIKKDWLLIIIGLLFWFISFSLYYYGLNNSPINTSSYFHHLFNYNPLLHLNSFILGIISGLIFKRFKKPLSVSKSLILILAPLVIIFILVISHHPILHYYNNGLLAPLFAVFLIGLASDKTWLTKLLSSRPLVLLGEISYGIYILQIPINAWWSAFFNRYLAGYPNFNFLGFFILLILISWLSFKFIEQPIRRCAKK